MEDIIAMIRQHVDRLFADPWYKDAHVFVFIEANLDYLMADAIGTMMRGIDKARIHVMGKDAKGKNRIGVWTGENEKQNFVSNLQRIFLDNSLHFAAEMIGHNLKRDKQALLEQLRVFRREVKERPDIAFGKPQVTYTGKSHGRKDDVAMALQICLYWLNAWRGTPEAADMATEFGWTQY